MLWSDFSGMTDTDQKDAETHINTAVTYSVWGGPYWPEQAGSGEDVGHESATSGGS